MAKRPNPLLDQARREYHAGNLNGAVELCRRHLRKHPTSVEGMQIQAGALMAAGRQLMAVELLEKAIMLKPRGGSLHHDLAIAYRFAGRIDDAERALVRACEIEPDNIMFQAARANFYQFQGRVEDAVEIMKGLVEAHPDDLPTIIAYARTVAEVGDHETCLAYCEKAMEHKAMTPRVRMQVLYSMGASLDKLHRYDEAWATFTEANAMTPGSFSPEAYEKAVDALIEAWTPERLETLPRATVTSDRPIFIVGMPRSGTSLVEQILASHSTVTGGGELDRIHRIAAKIQGSSNMAADGATLSDLDRVTTEALDEGATFYLNSLDIVDAEASHITDKMPNNHRQVGLMFLLFPDAPVIHCTRDPLDTCLSIWFQLFAGGVPFSNDLRHIGAYHRQYERLMAHWNDLFGDRILEANYETIVRDQEAQTKRLLEFCDLEFEDSCLRFHESKRVTITASNQQVRKPLYSSSVARHERYRDHIQPLRDALLGP